MKVHEDSSGTLVVTHDGTRLATWIGGLAGLLVVGAAIEAFSATGERFVGLLAGSATLLLAALAFFERGRFEFDPRTRTIRWDRRWAWWHGEGSIPFEQVTHVIAHRPIGDDGEPSRRVCLRLAGRPELPLTAAFVPDGGGAQLELARRIRRILGLESPAGVAGDVDSLVRSGRTIEAVKRLREETGASLDDAVRQVDAVKSRAR